MVHTQDFPEQPCPDPIIAHMLATQPPTARPMTKPLGIPPRGHSGLAAEVRAVIDVRKPSIRCLPERLNILFGSKSGSRCWFSTGQQKSEQQHGRCRVGSVDRSTSRTLTPTVLAAPANIIGEKPPDDVAFRGQEGPNVPPAHGTTALPSAEAPRHGGPHCGEVSAEAGGGGGDFWTPRLML